MTLDNTNKNKQHYRVYTEVGWHTHRYTLIIRNVFIRDTSVVEVAELNWRHWEASCDFIEPITYHQSNCIL